MGYNFGKEKREHDWLMSIIQNITNSLAELKGIINEGDARGIFYRNTYADVRALDTADHNVACWTFGKTAVDDGFVSVFDWVAGNVDADDGNTTLRPNDFDASIGGTWKRRL